MSNHQHPHNCHHRFSSMDSLPLHGSLISNNRSLTVQAHSSFHEPTSSVLPSYRSNSSHHNLYEHHNREWLLTKLVMAYHQPAIGRLPPFIHGFLWQASGDSVGLKISSSSNQGESKKIYLALKL
ncbi:hypothetical protein MKW98_026951 [Papaver atlanticum]|uniref:Uncharacterized protein n=1 Tax=Papaver atlanticum TaxID=357466 RepID=A0AAD4SVV3_9MAGN|nr:hypothetical protein MKW98_026951 [Papaver atlanticum]